MYIRNSQVFNINSSNRVSGSNSSFTYIMDVDNEKKFDSVCLLSCSIPKSYYMVQAGHNTFTLNEDGKSTTITVAKGNYGATRFATYLSALLNTNSPNGLTYSITVPGPLAAPNTGKFTYTVASGGGINPSFTFGENLYELMGFNKNSTNTFSGYTLTSTNVVKFQAEDTLFIHSSIVSQMRNDILQGIYAGATPDNGSIIYECRDVEAHSKPFVTSKNNSFTFSISDEDGVEMDLNGQNCVMEILVYKKETAIQNMLEIMKYQVASWIRDL